MKHAPSLPVPEPIRGLQPGTWAHSTITVRMPDIARRVLDENELPTAVAGRIRALIEEIPAAPLRPLVDPGAPDLAAWNAWLAPSLGQSWLEVPWFLAETYFYRRIIEAVGYFQPGALGGLDPFSYQKRRGLEATLDPAELLAASVAGTAREGEWDPGLFSQLVRADLWGNRADLSLWPADGPRAKGGETFAQADRFLLISDVDSAQAYLDTTAGPSFRVDFVADNAGFELVSDLLLADYLLLSRKATQVRIHLKLHPTFVSDALMQDVRHTLAVLSAAGPPALHAAADRLAEALHGGRLQLSTHPYWTSPLSGWQMPEELRVELAESGLVIVKGDANYRRLLGDRLWPYTTPFEEIVSYFPAPLLALRTLKAELAAGLSPEQVSRLEREDPEWLTNGRWGVIHFVLT